MQTTTPAPTGQACGSSTIASPVQGTVTSNYGPRWGRNHDGIDISAPTGTPVRAAACGTVSLAAQQSGYGNMVCITHTSQFSTCYAHLSRFGVTDGAQVRQGQVIGYVGCTGSCTGPHLHFETRVGGEAKDPRTYLNGGSVPGMASASTSSTANVGGPDLPPELLAQSAGGGVTATTGTPAATTETPAATTETPAATTGTPSAVTDMSATTQTAPGTTEAGTVGYETVTTSDGTVTTGSEVVTDADTTAPETIAAETEVAAPAEPVAAEAAPAAEPVAVEAATPVADVAAAAAPAEVAAPAAEVAAPAAQAGVDAQAAVSGGVAAQ